MVTDLVIVDQTGKSAWKPLQTCALLSTLCALQLLEHYVVEKKFRFLMLSRHSQDALENLLSTISVQAAIPRAREFKATLRVIVLAQFSQPSHHGSYAVDGEQDLLAFVRDKSEYEKQLGEEVDTSFEGILELCEEEEEDSLLYLAGYMAYAVIHKYKLCSTCKASPVDFDKAIPELVALKCYVNKGRNPLKVPQTCLWNCCTRVRNCFV